MHLTFKEFAKVMIFIILPVLLYFMLFAFLISLIPIFIFQIVAFVVLIIPVMYFSILLITKLSDKFMA
jgi:hypothetical protein